MARAHQLTAIVASATLLVVLLTERGGAHKPITSPFTYNEDVFSVLRAHCGRCHVAEGVAPMSLMTYEEAVPWGESIRVELLARHMPPWSVDAAPGRFRNTPSLSARETNLVLTWVTGGTPPGDPDKTPPPVALDRRWVLGAPDVELPLGEFTLPESAQEETAEFVVATGLPAPRRVRAVDLAPGTPAVVRSATVRIKSAGAPGSSSAVVDEPLVALWLPGDEPTSADGAGFELPAHAQLLVRIRYKKTWQHERQQLRDRSTVGLYFAPEASVPVRAVKLMPEHAGRPARTGRVSFSRTLDERVHAVAIYPEAHPDNVGIVVAAVDPAGSRRELIAFHPRADWPRRYWFEEPITLERGTRVETTVTVDDETPALPLAPAIEISPPDLSAVRLTLNVIAASR